MQHRDNPENGPSFGADSLVIPMGKEKPKIARSKLGSYYERFADGTNSLFGKGKNQVVLKDLKVYHGVYEEGEFIPFTDGAYTVETQKEMEGIQRVLMVFPSRFCLISQ